MGAELDPDDPSVPSGTASSRGPLVRQVTELAIDLRNSDLVKVVAGLLLSVSCASLALSGTPDGLPGIAGLVFVVATGLAAFGCLGIIVDEVAKARERRLELARADHDQVEALSHSIRKDAAEKRRLLP